VVVDNKHSGIPLRSTSLNYMESLLAQTALTLENVRQRRARSLLIDRTHTIMSMATGERTLSEMLQQICKVARDIMHADCVVIYPLHSSEPPHEYDIANIAAVGLTHDTKPIKDKPRQRGVNAHILKTGTMRVEDTQIDPMVSSHNFILRERIRAFIGSPMRTMLDRRPYGVFYLNYRTPQAFSAQDTRQVESLASLAAVVISNYRTARGTQEQDLQIFSRVLGAALAAEREEDVIRALLDGAQDLLHQHDTRIGLLLLQLVNPANAHYAVRALRREHFLESGNLKTQTKEDPYQGISGHALRTGETQHVTDVRLPPWNESFVDEQIATRSELDVPIKLGNMVIGVFNMESPHVNAFSPQQQQAIERLASEAALALDNVRRQGNLYTVLKAVRALIAPTNLSQTLDAILDAVRSAAPSLSALSIWYREQDDRASQEPETIWRIRQFGMRHHQASTITETPPIVTYMMQTRDPLWAPHIDTVPELRGSFVEQEEIASLAAFPLRFGGRRVGVMFLHYRQEHSFTQEEKALFPILADIAAASIQDAARLREIEQERRRLRAALDISEAVGTTFDLDEILRKIMRVLHELFPGASPCVLTYEPQNNALVFKKASLEFYKVDNPRYQDLRPREPLAEHGEGITGYLARRSLHSRQVEWYVTKGSAKDDPYYRDLILSTQSELCLTLMSGEQLLGVLMLESPEINAFDANDVALVLAVGRQISVALERSYNSEQLEFKNTMIALSAWGAEVSHDINREVGYIRRRVNWLSTEPLSMKGKQYLDEIDYSAEMLAASLPGTEHVHKRAASIDLDEWLVDRIEEMVERQGADVEVQIATNGQEQRVSTHPPTLQRILRHLVRNALRAMGDEGRLLVRTAIYEQQFEIQLEDTGPGIPAYLVPMVFKQKIEADTEGGLGLLIVRTLVENLGGRITLHDPEPGRGAIFTLWLPQEQNTQAEES
jgi:GAF domain-containing protein